MDKQALLKTEGMVMEITEKEYKLVSACKGNIISGISALMFLGHRIDGKRENGDFDLLS